ncbi:MAG: hypothetical protein NTV52_03020 [Acidobacteria bacterium]|nr:hypothetical protein [Acidobacteriota bacterium]
MIDLTEKTQAQKDVETVNSELLLFIEHFACAIRALNNSRAVFWSFPDDRLNAMFIEIGAEKLQTVFENHAASAEQLNDLAERCGIEARAETGAMRNIELIEGNFQLVKPTPEPS